MLTSLFVIGMTVYGAVSAGWGGAGRFFLFSLLVALTVRFIIRAVAGRTMK